MKKLLPIIFFLTCAFVFGKGDIWLVNFEKGAEVYRNLESIKLKKDTLLSPDDIIDTSAGGVLVVRQGVGPNYGIFRNSARKADDALEYRQLSPVLAGRINEADRNLEAIFIQGDQIAGYQAEIRKKNINLFLILDVSTSMVPFFEEIKIFIEGPILNEILIGGDYLYFYTFGEFIRPRVDKFIELPRDSIKVSDIIHSISADEEATDIGLALEALDEKLEENLPFDDSVVFFITDGRNDPLPESPYAGVDIYAEGAFDAYQKIRKGNYKVMLLSIGPQTAAKDLSGPLGGEYIEVSSDLTAEGLYGLISDFAGDIELIAPESLGKTGKRKIKVKLAFLSSYVSDKEIEIENVTFSINGGEKIPVTSFAPNFVLPANRQILETFELELPKYINKGNNVISLEITAGNISLSNSLVDMTLRYAPFNYLLLVLIILIVLALAALIFILFRRSY